MADISTRCKRRPSQEEWAVGEPVKDVLHFVKALIRMNLSSPERLPSAECSSILNDPLRDASALVNTAGHAGLHQSQEL